MHVFIIESSGSLLEWKIVRVLSPATPRRGEVRTERKKVDGKKRPTTKRPGVRLSLGLANVLRRALFARSTLIAQSSR